MSMDIKQFVRERNAALLSLDKDRIVAYLTKYGEKPHPDEEIFWIGIHKARTACTQLPKAARLESKRWLDERGYSSMDNGDLS